MKHSQFETKGLLPLTRNSSLHLRAPAKINWFLTIIKKRDDGYHDIMSLMHCVKLYDDIFIKKGDAIEVFSDLDISLEDNLVYKTVSLFKRHTSYKKGAKIILRKNIPLSAGLGGGSSDAAYTLLGLNILWGIHLSKKELSSIGAEIGSDVPFFLNGPSAYVEGRGEKITPVQINSKIVFLLVKSSASVSTSWAYTNFDRLTMSKLTKRPVDIKLFCGALKTKNFNLLGSMLNNDLERVVIERYPVVGEIKEGLLKKGAIVSAMSGSGPTVFGVFESKGRALSVAKEMAPHWCKVVESITEAID